MVQQIRSFRTTLLVGLALALPVAGCREPALSLGESRAQARANSDALFYSLAARFGPTTAAPGYEDARTKFSRSALTPSRIYNDRQLWTSSEANARLLELGGRPAGSSYILGFRDAGAPRAAGEYLRTNRLRQLGREEYEWRVRDELAVGPVSPDELGAALSALLRAAEGTGSAAARAAYRAMLPRTTAALGRLFTLDSLAIAPAPGGGTFVTLASTMHHQRIANGFPNFSRYLDRYARPARWELTVHDEQGMRWWVTTKDGDRMTLRLKVHDGRIAPLDGPPRRMPARMRFHADMATRIRIFNIGANDLRGEVTLTRTSREKSFTARFRQEPDWRLPLLVERMIRTPLRRPFEGNGAMLGFAARDAGGRTVFVRDYEIAVQESAIVRWFGGLGQSALGDFRQGAEREYERFMGELFTALRADAAALTQ